MFNMYQKINREKEEDKEANVIGHDRFCQTRVSTRSSKRKRKAAAARRTQSVAEFSNATLGSAASKRDAFKTRSHSSEAGGGSSELLVKIFNKNTWGSAVRHEYSILKRGDSLGSDKQATDVQLINSNFVTCRHFLSINNRYELNTQLDHIGSRDNKHWFIVRDIALKAERLLTVVPLTAFCPLAPSEATRQTVLGLFRGLQHPYIHPVLDIEFWDGQVALVSPLNQSGSLRDLIHSCVWHEDFDNKYSGQGEALPLWQIQRLGRQILEALLFLRERRFPPFHHLHSGNVILQNGVARLAGLENTLLALKPHCQTATSNSASFGYLLYKMASGYELLAPPSAAHLDIELERMPKLADVLRFIFDSGKEPPCLEELLRCDFFQGVELRELRGINVAQRQNSADIAELLESVRSPIRQRLEDILEEDEEATELMVRVER